MKQIVDDLIDRLAGWLGWTVEPEGEPAWLVLVAKDGGRAEHPAPAQESCGRSWV